MSKGLPSSSGLFVSSRCLIYKVHTVSLGASPSVANFDRIPPVYHFVKPFFAFFQSFFPEPHLKIRKPLSQNGFALFPLLSEVLCAESTSSAPCPEYSSTPRPSIETGGSLLVGLYQCCLPHFLQGIRLAEMLDLGHCPCFCQLPKTCRASFVPFLTSCETVWNLLLLGMTDLDLA